MSSKLAQAGKPTTENVSASASGSDAEGVNRYSTFSTTDVAGEPDIWGARLPVVGDSPIEGLLLPPLSVPHALSATPVIAAAAIRNARSAQ